MAKFTKDEFISGLKEMTILEVKELVDAMKEEFGVDPSAVAVAAAPAQGDAAGQHRSQAGIFERHRLRCGIYGEWHLRMD